MKNKYEDAGISISDGNAMLDGIVITRLTRLIQYMCMLRFDMHDPDRGLVVIYSEKAQRKMTEVEVISYEQYLNRHTETAHTFLSKWNENNPNPVGF